MNRREFLHRSTRTTLALGLASPVRVPDPAEATLPGTAPLTAEGDIATQMVDGIHRFLLQRTSEAAAERTSRWKRDYGSEENYNRSISPNRERLRSIIGAVDVRAAKTEPELLATATASAVIAEAADYFIYAVRWNVLDKVPRTRSHASTG